jgi:hypothetical protein
MTDLPIVCTLSAEALRARKQGLLAQVARRATCMTKIPAGYRFEFDAGSDTLSLVATMIDAERQCCRFLQFELSVGPDLGPLTLTLTGPEGTQQFVEALLDTV